jgi:hypothetical protein
VFGATEAGLWPQADIASMDITAIAVMAFICMLPLSYVQRPATRRVAEDRSGRGRQRLPGASHKKSAQQGNLTGARDDTAGRLAEDFAGSAG